MTELSDKNYDVIIVGGGNAALCAALSAREQGSSVLLLERAPIEERGGNSVYTDGLMRVVYEGADDIRALAPDLHRPGGERQRFRQLHRSPISSTTWRGSRNTAPTRIFARSWSGAARKRCSGCAIRACVSCRISVARRTGSTADSSSGAARPSLSRPAALVSSTRSMCARKRTASTSSTKRGRGT